LLAALLLLPALPVAYAAPNDAPASFDSSGVFIYTPTNAATLGRPLQVVFALHGMGGEGRGFCQSFLNAAERNGWIIVAPTFSYRNWKDPATVADDDVALTRDLANLLDTLPARTGLPTSKRAILLGFSRGAQLAHRFALAYPERTRAIAAMSAGSYTVPSSVDAAGASLAFPFGTADLGKRLNRSIDGRAVSKVDFWIAVGGDDTNVDDVPRQWDTLLGKTRVQRAGRFAQQMADLGARTQFDVFPGVGHAMSPDMVRGATTFMEAESARDDVATRLIPLGSPIPGVM
jgi:predicted esterase